MCFDAFSIWTRPPPTRSASSGWPSQQLVKINKEPLSLLLSPQAWKRTNPPPASYHLETLADIGDAAGVRRDETEKAEKYTDMCQCVVMEVRDSLNQSTRSLSVTPEDSSRGRFGAGVTSYLWKYWWSQFYCSRWLCMWMTDVCKGF